MTLTQFTKSKLMYQDPNQNTYLVNVPKWVHLVRSLDSKNQIKWLATCGFKWFVDPIELIYLIGCLGAGNGVGERHPNQSVRNITQYLSSLYVSWHKSTIVLCNFQIKIIFFDIFFWFASPCWTMTCQTEAYIRMYLTSNLKSRHALFFVSALVLCDPKLLN